MENMKQDIKELKEELATLKAHVDCKTDNLFTAIAFKINRTEFNDKIQAYPIMQDQGRIRSHIAPLEKHLGIRSKQVCRYTGVGGYNCTGCTKDCKGPITKYVKYNYTPKKDTIGDETKKASVLYGSATAIENNAISVDDLTKLLDIKDEEKVMKILISEGKYSVWRGNTSTSIQTPFLASISEAINYMYELISKLRTEDE